MREGLIQVELVNSRGESPVYGIPAAPEVRPGLKLRLRAYELYEERGRIDGHASDDWLQAEAKVLGAKKHGSKSKRIQ